MAIKTLELRKIPFGKKGSIRYEVIEEGKVIATRISSRHYVACYVVVHNGQFTAPNFFARLDLVGKGGTKYIGEAAYAIAYLKE